MTLEEASSEEMEEDPMAPVHSPRVTAGGCCLVFSDGSVAGTGHSGSGISAGWFFSGSNVSGSASIACMCNGSGAGELLGIVAALHFAFTMRVAREFFIFQGDNQTMMHHVFHTSEPTTKKGRDLLPGILLARVLLAKLKQSNCVSYSWVPRNQNQDANSLSRRALRDRNGWWASQYDELDGLPDSFPEVFRLMGANRQQCDPRLCILSLPAAAFRDASSSSSICGTL
jgi:ribonuclease HI